jgi:nucleoside-diphosphate-sugar epimerase
MKIVVAGSTGFVGTEVIRQALSIPEVTEIVALGRRDVTAPDNLGPKADVSKLQSLVLKDFLNYTDEVKAKLTGADAVIWYVMPPPVSSELAQIVLQPGLDAFECKDALRRMICVPIGQI